MKRKKKLLKLDLGCGQNRHDGYVGVDIIALPKVDVIHDLRYAPWPWKSNSVDEVFCAHFFEHLTGPERIVFMNELGRVLKPKRQAVMIMPNWGSERAVADPTHQWPPLCRASFFYFDKVWRTANKLDHYPITCDFTFTYGFDVSPDWQKRPPEEQEMGKEFYINVVRDLHVILTRRA
jgi:hypothetical protein